MNTLPQAKANWPEKKPEAAVLSITPDGRCALLSANHHLRVLDLESGKCLHTLKGHRDVVYCATVTRDGRRALSASADDTLRLWDLETGRCVRILNLPNPILSRASIMFEQGNAATGSDEDNIPVWDLESGQCLGLQA